MRPARDWQQTSRSRPAPRARPGFSGLRIRSREYISVKSDSQERILFPKSQWTWDTLFYLRTGVRESRPDGEYRIRTRDAEMRHDGGYGPAAHRPAGRAGIPSVELPAREVRLGGFGDGAFQVAGNSKRVRFLLWIREEKRAVCARIYMIDRKTKLRL